jgi:glycosyltransferase involved in cell wall biosynthesis
MKVLQIIDSLEAGGAERMAVNIANVLAKEGHDSHLCVTRKEGLLQQAIAPEVAYLFLNKKGKIGWRATFKLRSYIQKHQIEVIHAHSTSAYIAVLAFLFLKNKPKLIWHDHYGKANELVYRPFTLLKIISVFFDQIISVNKRLKAWAEKELKCKKVLYLENFALSAPTVPLLSPLGGTIGKRMVCLANLREQKDHLNLLQAFERLAPEYDEWTLHLCGQDFEDAYSKEIQHQIQKPALASRVFLLGSRPDVTAILNTCDIGVLSSNSEGLPVALLEYGLNKLPVIATDVGACKEVIANNGIVVSAENPQLLAAALEELMSNHKLRDRYAAQFQEHVLQHYGSALYVEKLMKIYNK